MGRGSRLSRMDPPRLIARRRHCRYLSHMLPKLMVVALAFVVAGCGASTTDEGAQRPDGSAAIDAASHDAGQDVALDAGQDVSEDAGEDVATDATEDVAQDASEDGQPDAAWDATQDSGQDAAAEASAACVGDSLEPNRNRLLETYYTYLKSSANTPQTNGLWSGNVSGVTEVWEKLDPSSRAVFLTLTARMQGSTLGEDGQSMLSHVTRVYRISGGEGATQNDPGSCGGGEYNRMMVSTDSVLHDAQVSANAAHGGTLPNGEAILGDVVASSYWRDSQDLAGPHTPFDLSNETEQGAPRGQTHYFEDPTSATANAPLGRTDLQALVDPYALEIDHDYDCFHNSNPLCKYVFYGPMCLPESEQAGTAIYTDSYGSYEESYQPAPCQ